LIPLKDNLPTSRFPVITVVLIAINVAVFIWQLGFSGEKANPEVAQLSNVDRSSLEYGAVPYRITHPGKDCFVGRSVTGESDIFCEGTAAAREARARGGTSSIDEAPWYVTVFTSMFMHGGILHIGFNMLFLWVFGNNIEDSMGRPRFVAFYLLAGVAAVYTQALLDTGSTAPTIGASGAIAGVLGGYALLYPRARVLTLVFVIFLATLIEIPAMILLGIWFFLQFLPAVGQVATPDVGAGGGVAYFAHVGGFVFGLALIKLFANRRKEVGPAVPVY
jgi:membrane associated rhomboid family serine protease